MVFAMQCRAWIDGWETRKESVCVYASVCLSLGYRVDPSFCSMKFLQMKMTKCSLSNEDCLCISMCPKAIMWPTFPGFVIWLIFDINTHTERHWYDWNRACNLKQIRRTLTHAHTISAEVSKHFIQAFEHLTKADSLLICALTEVIC